MTKPPIFTIFDLETTSTNPREARIVEIGARQVQGGKVIKEWSQLVKPQGFEIPETATEVHGITTEVAAKQGVSLRQAVQTFLGRARGTTVVGYNALGYDWPIIEREAARVGLKVGNFEILDPYIMGKNYGLTSPAMVEGKPSYKLSDLVKHKGAHRAFADVRATEEILNRQFTKAGTSSLDELSQRFAGGFGASTRLQEAAAARTAKGVEGIRAIAMHDAFIASVSAPPVSAPPVSGISRTLPRVPLKTFAKVAGIGILGYLTVSGLSKRPRSNTSGNVIPGFSSGGMAAASREQYDFGSPWKGMRSFDLGKAVRTFKDSAAWGKYRRYVGPILSIGLGATDLYVSENKGAALIANTASIATTLAFRKSTSLLSFIAPVSTYIGGYILGEYVFGSTEKNTAVGGAIQSAINKKTRVAKAILGPGALEDPNPNLSPLYNKAQDIPAYKLARASSMGMSESKLFKRMSQISYPPDLLKASAQAGTALHMLEEKRMKASGQAVETERFVYDPVHEISGHIDVIEAGNVPADIKTVSRNIFEKIQRTGRAKKANISQVQFYMHAMGAKTGRLHYIMREDPSQRINMEFDYDPELMQQNFDKLQRVRARIKMGLSAGFLKEENLPRTASIETLLNYQRQDHPEYSTPELQKIFGEEMEWLSRIKSNKAVNPIKAHDAGRWGRETTFASGDFEPGSSWKGIFKGIGKFFSRIFGRVVKRSAYGFSTKDIRDLAEKASQMSVHQFAEHVGVNIRKLDPSLEGAFHFSLMKPARKFVKAWRDKQRQLNYLVDTMEKQFGFKPGSTYVDVNVTNILGKEMRKIRRSTRKEIQAHGITMDEISNMPENPGKQRILRLFKEMPYMTGKTKQDMLKSIIFHEVAEARNVEAITSLSVRKIRKLIKASGTKFPSHHMAIVQEELFSRTLGNITKSKSRLWNAQLRDFSDDWFSGFDDAYNTIEGLRHGGLASELRKILTDFGSGWIRTAISRGMSWAKIGAAALGESTGWAGAAFGAHLKSIYAQQGLEATIKAARGAMGVSAGSRRFMIGKLIEKGSYKSAYEAYEIGPGAIPAKKFAYTEFLKDQSGYLSSTPFLRTGAAGALQGKLDINRVKEFTETYERSIATHGANYGNDELLTEIKAQQLAREQYGSIVPEVIGTVGNKGFIQEFAGKQLPESHIESAFRAAEKHYEEVFSQTGNRIVHYDLHAGNILRRGGKTTIIDWGQAAPTKVTERLASTGKEMMEFFKGVETEQITGAKFGLLNSMKTPGDIIKKLNLKSDTDRLLKVLEQQDNPFALEEAASVKQARRSKFDSAASNAQKVNPIYLNKYRRSSHGKNG